MIPHNQLNNGQSLRPDNAIQQMDIVPFDAQLQSGTVLSSNRTKSGVLAAIIRWPGVCLGRRDMKVAAKENRKALDYFTSTITPCHHLRAFAVLTIKHAVLLIGFGVGVMALVRLILAD